MENNKDILKWFDRELSDQEISELKQSENLDTLNKIGYYASQLQAPKIEAKAALEDFKNRVQTKKAPRVIPLKLKNFMKVAAILVVMLTTSYFLFFNNNVSYTTEIAQTQILNLPDGSEVILNADSQLEFNKKSWKSQRGLELSGEAFFKVKKGKTFTVNTGVGTVQVLGTQFNVKKRDGYFEVQCYEGLVAVNYQDKTVKLPRGKAFRVINDKIVDVDDFGEELPSWLKAESTFVKVPLSQVVAEFERQYDLRVILKDVDGSQLFIGTFTHKNRDIALQSITIPLNLNYKIEGNIVTLSKHEAH